MTYNPNHEIFIDGRAISTPLWMTAVQTLLIILATLCVSLRLYSRYSLKRTIAADDIFIVGGLIFAIARTIVACLSSQEGWAFREGPREPYQIPFYTHYFERRLFYALGACFIRVGVLVYYLRLFPPTLRTLRICSWVLLVLTFAQCIQLGITLAVLCDDIMDLYHGNLKGYSNPRCSYAYGFTYSGAIGDAVIDALIYVLPIPYIWGLRKIKLEQRIGLVVVFGLGLMTCVFALLQIPFIISNYRTRADGEQWFGSEVSLFIAIELALGLMTASLPDIRGLMARSFPNLMHPFKHTNDSSSAKTNPTDKSPTSGSEKKPSTAGPDLDLIQRPSLMLSPRKIKKPDWLRSTLASSLMDTRLSAQRSHSDRSNERIDEQIVVEPKTTTPNEPAKTEKGDDMEISLAPPRDGPT